MSIPRIAAHPASLFEQVLQSAPQPFHGFRSLSSRKTRCAVLGAMAAAVCCLATSCPLTPSPGEDAPDTSQEGPGPSDRVRVATFNTRCIVPEMDDLSVLTQIVNAFVKGTVLCDSTLADLVGGVLSIGGLTDTREEGRDRPRERATAIVALIKARQNDFDVLALNEVFLEDAREIFVDGLKSIFPYYVDKLEGSTICTEDSGLMLFSRWPLDELGKTLGTPEAPQGLPYYAGWTEYDDCRCEDCLAEKGVGYVRVRNPNTDEVYHVAFTHLQADSEACPLDDIAAAPPAEFSSVRNSQLAQLKELLESWIGKESQSWYDGTNVVVMGDLNVVGTQEQAALAAKLEAPGNGEWQQKFNPAQSVGYFAGNLSAPNNPSSPLYDGWTQTTSPWDPGVTSGSAKRYDYILFNAVPAVNAQPPYRRLLVPQHMTLLPFDDESDHYGVHAVLNRWQEYCMPVEALAAQAGYSAPGGPPGQPPWPNDQIYVLEITVPGGYQWLRFDLPGTYSFALVNSMNWSEQNDQSGFDLRVYTGTDLTFDIWNYYGEETDISEYFPPPATSVGLNPTQITAKKFLIPEAPFYVRISPKDPAGTGTYRLYAHRHEGRTKKDAILLPVCCAQEYFHGAATLNAEDMPWFQVNLERPDNTVAHQKLRFIVRWLPAPSPGTWLLRLQDENDTVLVQSTQEKASSPDVNENDPAYGEPGIWHYVEVIHENLEDLSSVPNPRFYLRVARPGMIIDGAVTSLYESYILRWETNLTILHGKTWAGTQSLRLRANDETCIDAGNSDEAGLQVWADDALLYDLTQNDIGGSATDMDSGDDVSLEKFIRPDGSLARYVDKFEFRVLEFDGGGSDKGEIRIIGELKPDKAKAWKASSKVGVPCSGVGEDGQYQLFYNRSRSMQYPPCN